MSPNHISDKRIPRWDARNYSAKDCDEWFAKERDWATTYNAHIKYASYAFIQGNMYNFSFSEMLVTSSTMWLMQD